MLEEGAQGFYISCWTTRQKSLNVPESQLRLLLLAVAFQEVWRNEPVEVTSWSPSLFQSKHF